MHICTFTLLLALSNLTCNIDNRFDKARTQCEEACDKVLEEKLAEVESIINEQCITKDELRELFYQAINLIEDIRQADAGQSDAEN